MAIATVAVLAYPMLLGPCCWISSRTGYGASAVSVAYRPVLLAVDAMPDSMRRRAVKVVLLYSEFGAGPNWYWSLEKKWRQYPAWRILPSGKRSAFTGNDTLNAWSGR
jgi:hypothetical protein